MIVNSVHLVGRCQSTIKRTIFLNDINFSNFYFPDGSDWSDIPPTWRHFYSNEMPIWDKHNRMFWLLSITHQGDLVKFWYMSIRRSNFQLKDHRFFVLYILLGNLKYFFYRVDMQMNLSRYGDRFKRNRKKGKKLQARNVCRNMYDDYYFFLWDYLR